MSRTNRERKFQRANGPGREYSRVRKFQGAKIPGANSLRGTKVPGNEKARERKDQGAKGPGSESSRERIGQGPNGRFAPGSELARERKGCELEMGRMSDYEGLGRLTERVPNVRPNFGRMLCARIKQRLLLVSALSGQKMS